MSKTTDDILNNAMRLSTTERAELAAALLASLGGEPEEAVEAAWAAEIQRGYGASPQGATCRLTNRQSSAIHRCPANFC